MRIIEASSMVLRIRDRALWNLRGEDVLVLSFSCQSVPDRTNSDEFCNWIDLIGIGLYVRRKYESSVGEMGRIV